MKRIGLWAAPLALALTVGFACGAFAQATGTDATGGTTSPSASGATGAGAASRSGAQPTINPQSNHVSGTPGQPAPAQAAPSASSTAGETQNNAAGPIGNQGGGEKSEPCNTGTACGE